MSARSTRTCSTRRCGSCGSSTRRVSTACSPPLVIREIVYRLLTGAQGSRMRHLATFGGHAHRMVRAVEKLRENFNKPLRIEDIA